MTDETNERIEYALSNIRAAIELVPDRNDAARIALYNQLKHAEYHLMRSE